MQPGATEFLNKNENHTLQHSQLLLQSERGPEKWFENISARSDRAEASVPPHELILCLPRGGGGRVQPITIAQSSEPELDMKLEVVGKKVLIMEIKWN